MGIALSEIADRLNQTTIRLGTDLSRITTLRPGQETAFPADVETEVYVVSRWRDEGTVHAISVSGDFVVIRCENRD